jgi:hypothetical protein
MGLVDRVQVTTQVSQVTQHAILALAEAHGIDAGEYRRHLIVRAVDIAQAEFRAAHGISAVEFLARDDSADSSHAIGSSFAIALLKSLVTGEDLDPIATEQVARELKIAPHQLLEKLQGGKQNGDRTIPRSAASRPV